MLRPFDFMILGCKTAWLPEMYWFSINILHDKLNLKVRFYIDETKPSPNNFFLVSLKFIGEDFKCFSVSVQVPDETSYPASAWRSRSCRMAARVKSGRMANRFVSSPQWAIMRSGVTITTGFRAVGAFCWESGEVMELLVSVSLWPAIHISEQLQSTKVVQTGF